MTPNLPDWLRSFQLAGSSAAVLTPGRIDIGSEEETLVASRLLEYEMWNRLHARDLVRSHGDALRLLLARIAFVEMSRAVLARTLQPFPAPVRTLDALHLASAAHLREHGADVSLATYDGRMREAGVTMGFELYRRA